jgi:hypothetical protein
MVIILSIISSGQAQEKLRIGEFKNGKLIVTNQQGLNTYLMNSLEKSGDLGKDYQVSTSPEGDRCLIYYPVSGNKNKVTSIGIMLVRIRNDFFIVENSKGSSPGSSGGGGSLEIQCVGDNCNICVPNIRWTGGNWMPDVYCECKQAGGSECNMTTKIVIHVDI